MALADDQLSRGMQLLLTTQAEVVAGIDRLFDQLLPVPARIGGHRQQLVEEPVDPGDDLGLRRQQQLHAA